jgi:hypothetical protein
LQSLKAQTGRRTEERQHGIEILGHGAVGQCALRSFHIAGLAIRESLGGVLAEVPADQRTRRRPSGITGIPPRFVRRKAGRERYDGGIDVLRLRAVTQVRHHLGDLLRP